MAHNNIEIKKLCVVVPVYNVEKYLKRCVDSLLSQSYNDFDIILVNDGSEDSSPKICDEYAKNYENISVIHKKNGGLSDARNTGTLTVNSEFILFIDSDDWALPTTIEYLLKAQKETNADTVIANWFYATKYTDPEKLDYIKPKLMDSELAIEKMLYQKEYTTNAWGKLYKTKLAKEFLYPVGKNCEDLFTTYKILNASESVAHLKLPLFAYFQRENSIMAAKYSKKNLDQLDAVDEIYTFALTKPNLLNSAASRKFSSYCQLYLRLPKELRKENFNRINQGLKQTVNIVLNDKNCRKKNRMAATIYKLFGAKGLLFIKKISK